MLSYLSSVKMIRCQAQFFTLKSLFSFPCARTGTDFCYGSQKAKNNEIVFLKILEQSQFLNQEQAWRTIPMPITLAKLRHVWKFNYSSKWQSDALTIMFLYCLKSWLVTLTLHHKTWCAATCSRTLQMWQINLCHGQMGQEKYLGEKSLVNVWVVREFQMLSP